MKAALETAWLAAGLQVSDLSHADRAKMAKAILKAVSLGVRDFKQLQQRALDVLECVRDRASGTATAAAASIGGGQR